MKIYNLQILHPTAPHGSRGKRMCYAKILNGICIISISENSLRCRKANDPYAMWLVKHTDTHTNSKCVTLTFIGLSKKRIKFQVWLYKLVFLETSMGSFFLLWSVHFVHLLINSSKRKQSIPSRLKSNKCQMLNNITLCLYLTLEWMAFWQVYSWQVL